MILVAILVFLPIAPSLCTVFKGVENKVASSQDEPFNKVDSFLDGKYRTESGPNDSFWWRFSRHLTHSRSIAHCAHGHSSDHATLDDATFASHFTGASSPNFFLSLSSQFCFSQCVGFWCWWSDHEFVLVESWSSWLWEKKDLE